MKSLKDVLNESLLDDFDDLIDASDKEVQHTVVNDPDFISAYGNGWSVENDVAVLNLSLHNKNKIKSYGGRTYNPIVLGSNQKSLDEWLGTKEVQVKSDIQFASLTNTLGLECNLLSKDTFSKKITFKDKNGNLSVRGRNLVIKDIDIEVSGKLNISDSWGQPLIGNANITLTDNVRMINVISEIIPCFMGLKSNVRTLRIHDTFIFDNEKCIKQLDDTLALPYDVKILDNQKKEEVSVKIKSFKKIHSIINNPKRYHLLEPILRFKSGFKVNDLLDVSGCKDLTDIHINNNLVLITMSKHKPTSTANNQTQVGDWLIGVTQHK